MLNLPVDFLINPCVSKRVFYFLRALIILMSLLFISIRMHMFKRVCLCMHKYVWMCVFFLNQRKNIHNQKELVFSHIYICMYVDISYVKLNAADCLFVWQKYVFYCCTIANTAIRTEFQFTVIRI